MAPNPTPRRILRLKAVLAKVGLGHDSVYRLGALGRFPKPIKLGSVASGWFEDEIDAWLAERAAERDAQISLLKPPRPNPTPHERKLAAAKVLRDKTNIEASGA